MKLIYKIAMIGTMLASGIVTASAQHTGRSAYDSPTRNWNTDVGSGPGSNGEGYNDVNETRDYGNYNESRDYIWATPQNRSYTSGD